MRKKSILKEKSKRFGLRVVGLYKYLCNKKKEFVLSKQVLRSGTSIGANISESAYAQSKADFVAKVSIALKEAAETEYWLELLHESEYWEDSSYESIHGDCTELIKMLTSSVKTAKDNEN